MQNGESTPHPHYSMLISKNAIEVSASMNYLGSIRLYFSLGVGVGWGGWELGGGTGHFSTGKMAVVGRGCWVSSGGVGAWGLGRLIPIPIQKERL